MRFQLLGPAETKKFLPISHRSHHITGKVTSRSHLDTCHRSTLINPVAPAAQFAWAMLPFTDPSLSRGVDLFWMDVDPWIPPDFFKCFLYVCEKDAYRILYINPLKWFLTGVDPNFATRGDLFAIFFGKMMKVKLASKSMLMMRWFLSLDMVVHELHLEDPWLPTLLS